MSFVRCTTCNGFVAHSYITDNGIDVYQCTSEHWNEGGRYFISTVAGLVEVTPKKQGKSWTYDIFDTEKRREREESKRINEELERRIKLYRNNMAEIERRQEEERRAAELSGESNDE